MKGQSLRGALSRGPQLERLSPGVYRGAQGQLVNQQGRQLQQQPQRPMQQPQQAPQPAPIRPGQLEQITNAVAGLRQQQGMDRAPAQPQMQNPSYMPQNYFNTPYRPWWLPPQNSPWWYQPPQQQEQPAQQDQSPVDQTLVKPQGQ